MAKAALSEEARINAPSSSSMAKKYQRSKRRAAEELGDHGLDDVNPLQIVIPQYLEPNVILNENIYIEGQLRKLIAFATPRAIHMLDIYREQIAIDGTFKVLKRLLKVILNFFRHHHVALNNYLLFMSS